MDKILSVFVTDILIHLKHIRGQPLAGLSTADYFWTLEYS